MAYLLSQLLTGSARRDPDNLAVVHEQRGYTYHELDAASNRFAHQLRSAGVGRGDRVGLYLEKSLEAVAALFGILKTGAARPGGPDATCRLHHCQLSDEGIGQHNRESGCFTRSAHGTRSSARRALGQMLT